jgi:hypothetical protein
MSRPPAARPTTPERTGSPAASLRVDVGRDGVRVRVRAVPGARRDAILEIHGGALRVAVRAAPERGRANAALEALVAGALGLRPAGVAVAAGSTGRDKVLLVRGLDEAAVRDRLLAAAGVKVAPEVGGEAGDRRARS